MKVYEVTIRATVTKTLSVEAWNHTSAEEAAHEQFSVLNDGVDENYNQETLRIEEDES
jgi:hypothetical protein|tara:strand:- start:226 stop:399 length:174 start_codon:yes stop_codon:yes gene_type:complete